MSKKMESEKKLTLFMLHYSKINKKNNQLNEKEY